MLDVRVMEINRIIDEWETTTNHPSTIVSNVAGVSLTKHGEVDKPNHEDLKKLIQLCKQIISQVESQCHTNPFATNHF